MKYLLGLLLLTGCSHFNVPIRDYTISETRHICLDDGECLLVSYVRGERDCGGWDPEQPYGWSQCNPDTIPIQAKKFAGNQ